MSRLYDVVVWGGTGFTGKLTCEYLAKTYPDLKWAVAGRNEAALKQVKASLNLPSSIDVLVGNIEDQKSLLAITSKTRVLLTTAGPYAKIGMPMVEACIEGGAHYCDLTGEAPFIREAVDRFSEKAQAKKVKIVNCCGFDCIPCDLGTQMIADEAFSRGCTSVSEIRFLADKTMGSVSGGTLASAMNIFESLPFSGLLKLLNPFYLCPRDPSTGEPTVPHASRALYSQSCDNTVMGYDSVTKRWTIPYLMQVVDTRLVNRSNALSDYRYGRTFVFSERMIVPNAIVALFGSIALSLMQALLVFPLSRYLIKRVSPQPGQGPSQWMLDNGYFTARLWVRAVHPGSGEEVLVQGSVRAFNGDPGYRQTAKMIAESAVCLAKDQDRLPATYGILTPSTAMGPTLRHRLVARGIEFNIDK